MGQSGGREWMAESRYCEETEWVCDECGLYGERRIAVAHGVETGHGVRELDPELTAQVREERALVRARRAVDFIALRRLRGS